MVTWVMTVLGAVSLLLWGMRMVRTGLMRAYRARIRRFLMRSSQRRLLSLATGGVAAAALQSSSATILLAAEFRASGMIGLTAGLAMAIGADVGSAVMVQILSLNIKQIAPFLLCAGYLAFTLGQSEQIRQTGRTGIGLGLVFLALSMIVHSADALRSELDFRQFETLLQAYPIAAVGLGFFLAWIAHSSIATVLFVSTLAYAGILPLSVVFMLVIGANVGSAMVPVYVTWWTEGRKAQIPIGNLLMRSTLAMLLILAAQGIDFVSLLEEFGPVQSTVLWHLGFNVLLAALFLPFLNPLARLIRSSIPVTLRKGASVRRSHLDSSALNVPRQSLDCATRELIYMSDRVEWMLRTFMSAFSGRASDQLTAVSKADDEVDDLHSAIKAYLTSLSRKAMSEQESERCVELINFATNLEHIGDIIDNDLADLARKRTKQDLRFSEDDWRDLTEVHHYVERQMRLAIGVLMSGDLESARELVVYRENFRNLKTAAEEHHLERLNARCVESIETSSLHLDILRDYKRICSHLTSVAYPILDAAGELQRSRLKSPDPVC